MPTPTAKTPSISVTTWPSACSTSRAKVGNSASRVAPTAQNQLIPKIANQTGGLRAAWRSSAQLSAAMFQRGRKPGCAAAHPGML